MPGESAVRGVSVARAVWAGPEVSVPGAGSARAAGSAGRRGWRARRVAVVVVAVVRRMFAVAGVVVMVTVVFVVSRVVPVRRAGLRWVVIALHDHGR